MWSRNCTGLATAASILAMTCSGGKRPAATPTEQPPAEEQPSRVNGVVVGKASEVAASCSTGARWQPGTRIFRETTRSSGLEAIGATGLRMGVTDIDGDGWPDLVIRRSGALPDDFSPGGHRATWLLRNRGDGRFVDVTRSSGFSRARQPVAAHVGRPGETVAFADLDNDGDLDAFVGLSAAEAATGETSEVLLNDGLGHFALGPAANPPRRAGERANPAGATFLDYDLDGNVDLWIADHGRGDTRSPDHLYRGHGDGSFTEVTAEAGLSTRSWEDVEAINRGRAHSRAWAAAACDLDDDGLPELLVASYGRSPNHLWQAARDATGRIRYQNQSVASGYAYDGDRGWKDNQFAGCYCKSNPGAEDCAGAIAPSIDCFENWAHDRGRQPFRLGGNSATTVCGDIDNDGDIDLLTTEIKHWWAGAGSDGSEVLVNGGASDIRFDRPGDGALGLAVAHPPSRWDEGHMSAALFDFDNDAWPDIYIGASDYPGNRGLLYHQEAPLAFVEVPTDDFFEHFRSHGTAVADFDRDGDLDLVVGHSHARCGDSGECYPTTQVRFFENILGQSGNWVQVSLEGSGGTNRAAIGARVTVSAGGVTQTQEVDGGHGHFGTQRDLTLHFGLGSACEAQVTVRWPDAALATETFRAPAGYRIYKRQGAEALVVSSLAR